MAVNCSWGTSQLWSDSGHENEGNGDGLPGLPNAAKLFTEMVLDPATVAINQLEARSQGKGPEMS